MNDYNLIEEFEEDFRLLESDENFSHSEDENDRQSRLGNLLEGGKCLIYLTMTKQENLSV